jgi:peptide/nickel transport system permease protein
LARYIVRRLLQAIPVLIGLSIVLFAFIHLLPGDPARTILGQRATEESLARLRAALGLDKPLYEQYLDYIGGLLQGDFGRSLVNDSRVLDEFLVRFPATIELTVAALLFAVGLGIPLGRLGARYAQRWPDGVVTIISLLGISIPIFVLGLSMQYLFGVVLGVLPVSGRVEVRLGIDAVTNFMLIDTLLAGSVDGFLSALSHLILPAIALGSIPLAIITRITRASVLDVANEDYVRTARAKGLSERRVDGRHIMRNAWLPVTTVIGLSVGGLLAGAVITETVFSWNGVGRWVVDAIGDRDYFVIQSSILFFALIFVLVNLAVDIGYAVLNPRIRYS